MPKHNKSGKAKVQHTPTPPANNPPKTERPAWKQRWLDANERWNPGATPPRASNKVIASGSGFDTAGKKAPPPADDPELKEIADELGLTTNDLLLIHQKFVGK